MGGGQSRLREWAEGEFGRLGGRAGPAGGLALGQVLRVRVPEGMGVSPAHLGVLWVADSDRDGRVDLPELLAFADLCAACAREYPPHQFESLVHGRCALRLWEEARESPAGFADWFVALLRGAGGAAAGDAAGERGERGGAGAGGLGSGFVSRDAVELAHGLLGVLPAHGVGFQEFFDLLQREGEDRQLLDLRDEGLDDVVPVEVVRDFAAQVLQGFTEMFRDVVPEARAAGRGPGARAGAAGGAGAG